MSRTTDDLIGDYLQDLERELSALPTAARREVVDEIAAHIGELRAELGSDDEVGIRDVLDRVGDPADIAAEARERFGVGRPKRRNRVEVSAVVLLSVGSIVIPVVGWPAGVVLLWVSDVWSTRDKLLGTLIVPGGLGLPLWFLLTLLGSEGCSSSFDENGRLISQMCSGGPSNFDRFGLPTLLIAMLIGSLATTIYLGFRVRRLSRRAVLA